MQDKRLAECARCAQACELGLPRGDKEAVWERFGMLFSPEAEGFQHKLVLLPACLGAAAWAGAGLGCAQPGAGGGSCHPGAGSMEVPGCVVACSALSLGFKVLAVLSGSIICAVQMLQRGQSQALDEGSVVLAGDSSQCAAGQPILACQNASL